MSTRKRETQDDQRSRELDIARSVSKLRSTSLRTTRDVPSSLPKIASSGCDISGARDAISKVAAESGVKHAGVYFDRLSAGGKYHFDLEIPGMYTQGKICSVMVRPTLESPTIFSNDENEYPFTGEGIAQYAQDQKIALASPTRTFCVRTFVNGESQLKVVGKYANGDTVIRALKTAGFAIKPIQMSQLGKAEEILCLPMYADAAISTCQTAGVLSDKRAQEHASRDVEELRRQKEAIESTLSEIEAAVKARKKDVEEQEYGKYHALRGLDEPLDRAGLTDQLSKILDTLLEKVNDTRSKAIQFADDSIMTTDATTSGAPQYKGVVDTLSLKFGKLRDWSKTLEEALVRYTKKSVTEKMVIVSPEKYPDVVKHREGVLADEKRWKEEGIDVTHTSAIDDLALEYELLGALTLVLDEIDGDESRPLV